MANTPAQEIEILIRARYPVIYVVSWEETRVEEALQDIARRRDKKMMLWSVARGLQPYGAPQG
ncbi:MAG: ATPase, partial [Proteobacteria bacterium]